jgi:hypothetical protein
MNSKKNMANKIKIIQEYFHKDTMVKAKYKFFKKY